MTDQETKNEPASTSQQPVPHANPYAVIAQNAFSPRPAGRKISSSGSSRPRMHDHRDGFLSCLQCGICTSGCPAARFTSYNPRQIARRAAGGGSLVVGRRFGLVVFLLLHLPQPLSAQEQHRRHEPGDPLHAGRERLRAETRGDVRRLGRAVL